MDYTSRPKRGNARKAWDKFVEEQGVVPERIYYTPNYDYTGRGWICRWKIKDPCIKWLGKSGEACHTFYSVYEL